MRVLTLSTVFPNPVQPVHGLFVFERIRHAARLCRVRVVAPVAWYVRWRRAEVPRRDVMAGVPVERPAFYYVPRLFKILDGFLLFLSVLPSVLRLRQEFDFDLVDAHFGYPEGIAGILLGKWFRRPVVITLRGSEPTLTRNMLRKLAIGWALRRANAVVAVSHALGRMAQTLGVSETRIEVIENGVDTARFLPRDQAEVRRKLGIPQSAKMLVSVGALVARKGFHRVLRVLPELLQEIPDLLFVVVGGPGAEGNEGTALRTLAATLHVEDHVRWAGPQQPELVDTWLNAADVFVLASDYEGCPNVVWEALACGRPVVASKVGEVERMVPSFAGLLFDDPEDRAALRQCLGEAFRSTWDRERIRRFALERTWDHVAARVVRGWQRAAWHPIPKAPGEVESQQIPAECAEADTAEADKRNQEVRIGRSESVVS